MKKVGPFVFALMLLMAFIAPAMAATKKISFYGDVRFQTYWVKADKHFYGNDLGDDDSDLMWEPDTADSRFGAKFAGGPITANMEIRPRRSLWSTATTKSEKAYNKAFQQFWRQWWASWNFGPASLLIGFTYVPGCIAYFQSQMNTELVACYGGF